MFLARLRRPVLGGVILNMTDFEHVVHTGREIQWLTASEAAEYLKIQTRTLLLWARLGRVKGYILSGVSRHCWRFRQEDLDAIMALPSVPPVKG